MYSSSDVAERIKQFAKESNLSIKQVLSDVGLGFNTMSNMKTSMPKADNLAKIADYLNCSVDYLLGRTDDPEKTFSLTVLSDGSQGVPSENMFNLVKQQKSAPSLSDEAQNMAVQYDTLDLHGKDAVNSIMLCEINRMDAERQQPAMDTKSETKIIPLFGNSFAAGPAEPDFGNLFEDYEVDADSPAEFAIHIHGDSMEPYLPDGSIALGRKETPVDGDVAAILLDGSFLCKQVCEDNFGNLYLFSLNRARDDMDVMIMHDGDRYVKCFGTIIMKKRVPLPR